MRALWTAAVLGGALLLGAFLRFDGLGDPSFWIDEILHQNITTSAASEAWWKWVVGFEPENGPLYYATQLATRIGGTGESAARAAAALCGLGAIVLVGLAAKRDGIAAILLAVSPLHVYYSREARPYALLMLLSAAMIVILLRARSRVAALLVLLAMAYTAAVAAPVVGAVAVTSFAAAWLEREQRRWYLTVGAMALAMLAVLPLLYRGASVDTGTHAAVYDAQFFSLLARNFSVTALASPLGGRTAFALVVFAVIGAVALARRDRRVAVVLVGMTVLPLGAAISALWLFDRWYAVRYVTPALIGYLLLAGAGIGAVARPFRKAGPAVALLIAALTVTQSWPACRTEAWQKLHWRLIAEKIVQYGRPGDVVIAAEAWSGLPLDFYLGRLPKRVEDVTMTNVELAQITAATSQGAWLVTTGGPSWMCGHPLVLTSAIDNFRMHYAGDFLGQRAQAPEARAAAAALGDAIVFGDGWAGEEGSGADAFRWAAAEEATLLIPHWGARDRTIPLRVAPHMHPLLPQQTIDISLNGQPITKLVLPPRTSDHELAIPARFWRNGINTLTFRFAYAVAPAELPGTNRDGRKLAASFQLPRSAPFAMRIAAQPLLDETNTWRGAESRFPAARLRREAVLPILGRLGFDPDTTWPRLARGELHLDHLAETLAYGSQCADDVTFVRTTFTLLLGRAPGELEERDLLARLREGMSRPRLTTRIVRSEEFRNAVILSRKAGEGSPAEAR